MRFVVPIVVPSLVVLLSQSCADPGGPGETGSATGDFDAAYVVASHGALEIVLGNGEDGCESRIERAAFEQERGLRIRLLAVNDTALARNSTAFFDSQTTIFPPPPAVTARNAFVAARIPLRQGDRQLTELSPAELPVAIDGEVSLERPPNYDTGAVDGWYELLINDTWYDGAFITRYCPGEEDLGPLADALYNACGLAPEIPYAPGSSDATALRDVERGLRALALSRQEKGCWQHVVDTYCVGGFPSTWLDAPEGGQECLVAEFDACIGAEPQRPSSCTD